MIGDSLATNGITLIDYTLTINRLRVAGWLGLLFSSTQSQKSDNIALEPDCPLGFSSQQRNQEVRLLSIRAGIWLFQEIWCQNLSLWGLLWCAFQMIVSTAQKGQVFEI